MSETDHIEFRGVSRMRVDFYHIAIATKQLSYLRVSLLQWHTLHIHLLLEGGGGGRRGRKREGRRSSVRRPGPCVAVKITQTWSGFECLVRLLPRDTPFETDIKCL